MQPIGASFVVSGRYTSSGTLACRTVSPGMTTARLDTALAITVPWSIANLHTLRDLAQPSWASKVILPDMCPDRGSSWSFRRSSRYGRRSVKPSANPTLVRTRHLPLLLAWGSRRDQDPLSAATLGLKALQALLSRHIAARLGMPGSNPQREPSTQKPLTPVPTRQNSRFRMSATSRTVIVCGVPNGGDARLI
jgi:hypothetical protein